MNSYSHRWGPGSQRRPSLAPTPTSPSETSRKSPFFEIAFARLGYFRRDAWSLWARRYNDRWIVIDYQLALEACFKEMRQNPWFSV